MNKPLKNYWFSNLIAIVIILCSSFQRTTAQNSFFIKFQILGGYFPEVFEDKKGCIIAKYDFRVLRINPDGRILWNTRDLNIVKGACIPDSQGYIFPSLASEMGGFYIQSFDYKGKRKWGAYEIIDPKERMRSIHDFIIDSARRQYIVAGDKSYVWNIDSYWIAGLDYSGKVIWERDWHDGVKGRRFHKIFKNETTGGYILLSEDDDIDDRKEIFHLDSLGRIIDRNLFEPSNCYENSSDYRLLDNGFCKYSNGYLGLVNISSRNDCNKLEDGRYFYIYNNVGKLIKREWMTSENDIGYISQIANNNILGIYFDSLTPGIKILDHNLKVKWKKLLPFLPEGYYITGMNIIKSKDGGFIGIVTEDNGNEDFVTIFKTDSLGNINQKEEYSEKKQPFMLQPNPASGKVRLAIPYYYGNITADFYDLHGVFLYSETKNELEDFDISALSPGVYIVKAELLETGERRTMKLVVQ
jgi:hypothetical protein